MRDNKYFVKGIFSAGKRGGGKAGLLRFENLPTSLLMFF